jgi:flagellar biosynthesis/type III secretory pathway protein FliH
MSSYNQRVDRLQIDPVKALPAPAQRNYDNLPRLVQKQVKQEYTLNVKANSRDEYIQALDEAHAQALINLGRDEAFEQGGYSV